MGNVGCRGVMWGVDGLRRVKMSKEGCRWVMWGVEELCGVSMG